MRVSRTRAGRLGETGGLLIGWVDWLNFVAGIATPAIRSVVSVERGKPLQ